MCFSHNIVLVARPTSSSGQVYCILADFTGQLDHIPSAAKTFLIHTETHRAEYEMKNSGLEYGCITRLKHGKLLILSIYLLDFYLSDT